MKNSTRTRETERGERGWKVKNGRREALAVGKTTGAQAGAAEPGRDQSRLPSLSAEITRHESFMTEGLR